MPALQPQPIASLLSSIKSRPQFSLTPEEQRSVQSQSHLTAQLAQALVRFIQTVVVDVVSDVVQVASTDAHVYDMTNEVLI
jgi:hypothetical protein